MALLRASMGWVMIDRARGVSDRSREHSVAAGLDGAFEALILDGKVAIGYVGKAESGASFYEAVR